MKRVPALDGLRGLAILLVVVYHAWPDVVPGGAYGVTLFFVLSGFLITTILIRELDHDGGVDFRGFYRRRAARLLPALLVVASAYLAIGGPWGDVWPALAYVANVPQASGTYLGDMSSTWSLAIEEHFYIVWPVVLAVIPRDRRRMTATATLAVALGWRVWMLAGGASWERVYYGTDTMAFAILAGCWLAVARPAWRSQLAVVGVVAAALVIPTSRGESIGALWAMFAVAGLCVVAVNTALSGSRLLEWRPLRWLGTISYGLYLWHAVVLGVGLPRPVAVVLSVVLAWLMWRTVEEPILRWARSPIWRTGSLRPAAVDSSRVTGHTR